MSPEILPIIKENILNLGCGSNLLKDTSKIHYVNADMIKKPGVFKFNLMKLPWPWLNATFDQVYLFHTIEHIPSEKHPYLLNEIRRILKPAGKLCISYPEFPKVASNYLNNKGDDRAWWAKVIYGRGLTEWDRHKALMDTPVFAQLLRQVGFDILSAKPEKKEDYNTMLVCQRGEPLVTYETLLGEDFALPPSKT